MGPKYSVRCLEYVSEYEDTVMKSWEQAHLYKSVAASLRSLAASHDRMILVRQSVA